MGRTGKYLLTPLDDGRVLARPSRHDRPPDDRQRARRLPLVHDHVELGLEDGATLVYNDPRRFGRLDVLDADAVPAVVGPGVDALDPDAHRRLALRARARSRARR